ncbi:M23 family metallopeptidase [Peribacillus asahii]|uniref:M23 family metallopeptidase n=1 Tax=Peribacillus asahii TaxID=228899 RepID=UPI003816FC6A
MPYQYQRTPFSPTRQAFMYRTDMGTGIFTGCHNTATLTSGLGSKDIGANTDNTANTIQWGEPVYAIEDGTVVSIVRNSTCFSPKISLTQADTDPSKRVTSPNLAADTTNPSERAPFNCLSANLITIQGNDNFFTEYVHVLPNMKLPDNTDLRVGTRVTAGTLLGQVDNSAETGAPHVHLARYKPNPNFNSSNPSFSPYWQNGGTCNWTMFGVRNIVPTAQGDGWVLDEDNIQNGPNGAWYFYVNNTRQRGRVRIGTDFFFFDPTTGVFTGFAQNSQGTFFFWNGTGWDLIG